MKQQDLVSVLSKHYGISSEFCARYLADNNLSERNGHDLNSFLTGLSETERLYLDYALSTNRRGETVRRQLDVGPGAPHKRVLDIGCGQGGTVRAFTVAGQEAIGLEIDPGLAEYARLNLGSQQDRVKCLDILACDIGELGTFDLILCSDVIEHVGNPDLMIAIAARLLRPGGTFVLQVPNKDSIHQVIADGHFRIAGFTLLSRQEGRELKRQLQGWDDPYHHMGEHLPSAHYVVQMKANGLDVMVEPTTSDPARALSLFGEACGKVDYLLAHGNLSWFTHRELSGAFSNYGLRFLAAYRNAVSLGDMRDFAHCYVDAVWTIKAASPGSQ
jgi:2-polyprenyl-3-methyl-5-hydroxy-6-metoxy-1,4-benzoquinol methylase